MPRIDPLQLLKCLSVLLTPEGGILSRDEVPRLVNLMTKFSKKLVSKCVYLLILKNTDKELVDMFMAEGGWTLIQTWLQDAVQTSNWDLVQEILGLLLITPVDVERLKLNILPKLIKSLSRRDELDGVAKLSTQLVQQWLTIVKSSNLIVTQQIQMQLPPEQIEVAQLESVCSAPIEEPVKAAEYVEKREVDTGNVSEESDTSAINTGTFYRPSVRDGKLVIQKLASVEDAPEEIVVTEAVEEVISETEEKERSKEEEKKTDEKEKEKEKSKSKSSKSSSSRSSSHSRDRDRDKSRDKKKSSSSSKSSSKSKSSSSSSRDKDKKDKDRDKDKDRHRNNGSLKNSSSKSSSSKDRRDSKDKDKDKDKDKQAEKDKDTLAKIKPQTIEKLGRIPKKSTSSSSVDDAAKESKENKDVKKKTFSVGIRKDSEERPKTVKVFNSKMRSTGLEEEVKPAPPRSVKKPTPSVQLPTIPPKRPSPPRDHRDPILPPEKKLKIDKVDIPERPGAIKLIPPKPKPAVLQESDLFMDALTAATAKKEPKKRKRRPSVTKESPPSPSSSPSLDQPQATPTSPSQNGNNSNNVPTSPTSPSLGLKNIAPINFYQDTLSTEETAENGENDNKEKTSENNSEENVEAKEEDKDTPASPATPTDDNSDEPSEPKRVKVDGGLKGVLLYTKKKGPKKTISWKAEADLVEIRYFELDETERVNVTKTFGDMAKMEMTSERAALQLSRKIVGEDTMEAQITWKLPYLIEQPESLVPGHKSLEKDIQFAREKSVLQALYFDKRRIPDSPEEPIPENHQMSDPVLIPLEDPESQEIDLRSTPWPEPKGSPPHVEPQMPPHIFPTMPGSFNPPFNNMPPPQFQGMPPRFGGQVGPGGPGVPGPVGPGNFMPPNMTPNMNPNMLPNGNMMGPPNMGPPNGMMNPGPMNPNMFPPGPGHDGFGPGLGPGLGPGPDFPMFANQNPPNNMNMFPPNNFNHRQGNRGGGFRRGGGNSGNWVRMSGQGSWKRGGGRGGRLCKNIQNHGYCRNGDNCPFVHP